MDYLEFGIFRGFNLWYAQAYARSIGISDMRYFGFDSFFGIPPVSGVDAGGVFKEGDFSAYRDEVEEFLSRYGVDWQRTFLIPGFFDDSLTVETARKYRLRSCSLCVVDCDLYSSAVSVLRFVEPLLADRAILYFDDWDDFGGHTDKGEPKAFDEFLQHNRQKLSAEPFQDLRASGGKGKAFVIRRSLNGTLQG
jgi:hypothetical protein